jgi:DNA-binding GntR family transcriptional regulator
MKKNDFSLDFRVVKNLSAVIADRLAELIQTGALQPGEHLVQTVLAERFEVSRVAVRDALQELRRRGLAVNVPMRGTIVRPVSYKIIYDLFAVRRVIESLAVREACANMTKEGLGRIGKIINEQEELSRKKDMAGVIEKDWEFHKAIYEHCGNEPLNEIIISLWLRIRQVRSLAQVNITWGQDWSSKSVERHKHIFSALEDRNVEKVEKLIVETIESALEEIIEGLKESGWADDCAGNNKKTARKYV